MAEVRSGPCVQGQLEMVMKIQRSFGCELAERRRLDAQGDLESGSERGRGRVGNIEGAQERD